jgi:hypothetical protein
MWRAPRADSGCVIFTAMVLENNVRWYAEDDDLSKTICESTGGGETEDSNEAKCCACDEAKYSVSKLLEKSRRILSTNSVYLAADTAILP